MKYSNVDSPLPVVLPFNSHLGMVPHLSPNEVPLALANVPEVCISMLASACCKATCCARVCAPNSFMLGDKRPSNGSQVSSVEDTYTSPVYCPGGIQSNAGFSILQVNQSCPSQFHTWGCASGSSPVTS